MHFIEDFSDQRNKANCIHCDRSLTVAETNKDHVPTKSLLSKRTRKRGIAYDRGEGEITGYLPQVVVCKRCNSSFSKDETYLLCVLHAVTAGSLYPDPQIHPKAATVLRSNRNIVRSLKNCFDSQMDLFPDLLPFTLYPDPRKIRNVIIKNARGHIYHELGEPAFGDPDYSLFQPLSKMSKVALQEFEQRGARGLEVWPEVGSRMMLRVSSGLGFAGGWIEVEKDRYRYLVDWSNGLSVRTIIWEYLATETHWPA